MTSRDDHEAAPNRDAAVIQSAVLQIQGSLDALLAENQKLRLENISLIGQAGETQAENQQLCDALEKIMEELRDSPGYMRPLSTAYEIAETAIAAVSEHE